QGRFLLVPAGQLGFQVNRRARRARNVARSPCPGAGLFDLGLHGVDHHRVLAHAQVVVGAPDDDVLLGAVLIGLACLARAAFDGTAGLIASAVAVGVGVALIQALAPVVVKRAFPTRFGTVMGVYTTGIMGGAAVAAAPRGTISR
ncbi:hypothetical protein LTR94_031080, partial [Friedmanniomyces endolithicus]